MKGLVVYASCYGSTKRYADWISEETGFEAKPFKEVTDKELKAYDAIIIGSWVLANRLFLAKWIEEKKAILMEKKLGFYSVSGAVPEDECLREVFSCCVDEALLKNAECYRFGGKRETEKMSGFHKFMLWIATTFIEKDESRKQEMKRYTDNVDRKYITELVAKF